MQFNLSCILLIRNLLQSDRVDEVSANVQTLHDQLKQEQLTLCPAVEAELVTLQSEYIALQSHNNALLHAQKDRKLAEKSRDTRLTAAREHLLKHKVRCAMNLTMHLPDCIVVIRGFCRQDGVAQELEAELRELEFHLKTRQQIRRRGHELGDGTLVVEQATSAPDSSSIPKQRSTRRRKQR